MKELAKIMVRAGESLSIDHHDQGPALMGLLSLALMYRSPLMLAALVMYLIMHFSYGGSGTFQRPPRLGKAPGLIDIFLVLLGITGLLAYVGLILYYSYVWIESL